MWRYKEKLQELDVFYHEGSGDRTQVVRLTCFPGTRQSIDVLLPGEDPLSHSQLSSVAYSCTGLRFRGARSLGVSAGIFLLSSHFSGQMAETLQG